ncbi:MAG: hypothetical protein JNK05_17835 [Myxococcales bacterium]|nr:hypothetical protein [Myxococcales bacterium]
MITRGESVSKHLAKLAAEYPERFFHVVRMLGAALDAELLPSGCRALAPWPAGEDAARTRAAAFRGASFVLVGAARLGAEGLRSVVAMHAKTALLKAGSTREAAEERTRCERADWSDAEVSRPTAEELAMLGEHVLAERAGRRFVLRVGVIERDGVAWPSVSFALQVRREFVGWKTTRSFFIPWRSVDTVRAAIDTAIQAAYAANDRKATSR